MEKKVIVFVFTVLILLGIIGYVSTIKLTPPTNQYKSYVISGKVLPSEKIAGDQPSYVYAYYPYYNSNYLCRSSEREIKLSEIKWIDNTTGNFEIYFSIPLGLNEVILTNNCASCEHTTIDLTNIPSAINLKWGGEKCEEKFEVSNQNLLPSARNILSGVSSGLENNRFNASEKQDIQEYIKTGWEMIAQSDPKVESNESILYAHYSEWFALAAKGKLKLLNLKYCLQEQNALMERYADDPCYVPDHSTYEYYNEANSTYASMRTYTFRERDPFDTRDIDIMKRELTYLDGLNTRLSELNGKCEGSLRVINETFELQKPYCEARGIIFKATYVIWAIVLVYIGILIEKGMCVWKK